MSESEKVLLRNAQYLREDIGQGEVMYTRAAQIVGLSRNLFSFRIFSLRVYFKVSRQKYSILTFRDKKYHILRFRDKTESYLTVFQQNNVDAY